MSRHAFLIIVPVAERPRHLRACLTSLREALRRHPYPGRIRVLIADDSVSVESIAAHRRLAAEFAAPGLEMLHFPPDEQRALVRDLGVALPRVIGAAPRAPYGHKGQGVMRNIAYLKAAALLRARPEPTLIWSIDSDQEFRVDVPEQDGYLIDYFGALDALFAHHDIEVLTGKVVGDPPVSPAVMMRNFLDDLLAFLAAAATHDPDAPCQHHQPLNAPPDAAYHDMAELFGIRTLPSYAYPCPLSGAHSEAAGFAHFAARANSFFYGEHPTRVVGYQRIAPAESLQPARTVYAGNYVFRPSALRYFIPFAPLRLRMSGPTLGRIMKSELNARFVSANLPMLHKRTVESGGRSEFRPGIATSAQTVDISGEFERQFYGDVMLFSLERLTAAGDPCRLASAEFAQTLDQVHRDLLARYNARQAEVLERLARLKALLDDSTQWWNQRAGLADGFRVFAANVERNFGSDAAGPTSINDAAGWRRWRAQLLASLTHYCADRAAWMQLL